MHKGFGDNSYFVHHHTSKTMSKGIAAAAEGHEKDKASKKMSRARFPPHL